MVHDLIVAVCHQHLHHNTPGREPHNCRQHRRYYHWETTSWHKFKQSPRHGRGQHSPSSHLDVWTASNAHTSDSRSYTSYICRKEMWCKCRILRIPLGEHDLDRADRMNQGPNPPELPFSQKGHLVCPMWIGRLNAPTLGRTNAHPRTILHRCCPRYLELSRSLEVVVASQVNADSCNLLALWLDGVFFWPAATKNIRGAVEELHFLRVLPRKWLIVRIPCVRAWTTCERL